MKFSYWSWQGSINKILILVEQQKKNKRGAFNNHVDKISYIYRPTSRGQAWTFHWPSTYVHVDIHQPTPLSSFFFQFKKISFKNVYLITERVNFTLFWSILKCFFLQNSYVTNRRKLSFFLTFCPHGHLRDHLPTSRGKSWTFNQPPTHFILSTWLLNAPILYLIYLW